MTETAVYVAAFQALIAAPYPWVLFEHGTVVVVTEDAANMEQYATELLSQYGPVHAGSPAGDMKVIYPEYGGWIVSYPSHHNDILNYVHPDSVGSGALDYVIGLAGRSNRALDSQELTIVHVELTRGTQ